MPVIHQCVQIEVWKRTTNKYKHWDKRWS